MIYLDHNATTPVDSRVFAAMEPYLTRAFGNPSSVHSAGREARRAVELAREKVAALIGAEDPEEIVFTSGGTESDSLALSHLRSSEPGSAIVTTAVEHPAVAESARRLEAEGHAWRVIPVEPSGGMDLDAVRRALSPAPALVSVMAANNEYGAIFPVAEVAAMARSLGASVHCDAVSALGRLPIDVRSLGVDFLSISAHKIHGPKGTGALYVRRGIDLAAVFPGGGQERRRRGGTENVAGIVGFGEAAGFMAREGEASRAKLARLRDRFESEVSTRFRQTRIWGSEVARLPNTSAIAFPGSSGESLLIALDLAGVAVSVGSACSSGTLTPSPSILALGASRDEARSTLRFSFGKDNRENEIPPVIEALSAAVGRGRA
ncbi:MAG: cysteine desulfurase family protein [Thermoanaerobaculia bacterium]